MAYSHNTKDFNAKAMKFAEEYAPQREALEKCLETRVNDDINFVCQKPKSEYLKGIATTFCKDDYEAGVKCQKKAGDEWATKCFHENTKFGQCADSALKKLYIYNLENSRKNPNSVPSYREQKRLEQGGMQ
jgi:hypothetical protein